MALRRIGHPAAVFAASGSGGGSDSPDAETLLSGADVRFDFSTYDDADNMIDVNGGWGPLALTSGVDHEFTADGLHSDAGNLRFSFDTGVDGPLTFGPDGMTVIEVARLNTTLPSGVDDNGLLLLSDLASDWDDAFAPEWAVQWIVRGEDVGADSRYSDSLIDAPPGNDDIVDIHTVDYTDDATPVPVAGVYIQINVFDVGAGEARSIFVRPEGRWDMVDEFALTPAFASAPTVVNGMSMRLDGQGAAIPDFTLIEWIGWNRPLSLAEIAALIDHFEA